MFFLYGKQVLWGEIWVISMVMTLKSPKEVHNLFRELKFEWVGMQHMGWLVNYFFSVNNKGKEKKENKKIFFVWLGKKTKVG